VGKNIVLDQREAEELFKIIGAKITYYRRLKGVRQIDLAMETGISEQYLSRIEHGEKSKGLSVYVLVAIAAALDVKLEDLIN